MAGVSRRQLLTSGSLGVVAAGVGAALQATAATRSAAARDHHVAKDARLDGSLIAHVTDLQHGRISVYVEDREVQITDRELAARLYSASR